MDRRRFLQSTAAGGALVTIGVGQPGCGNHVSPAPLAKVMTLTAPDVPLTIRDAVLFDNSALDVNHYGTVQLLVDFYPQLAADGGAITLQLGPEIAPTNTRGYSVPIDNTILVIHEGTDFIAVQSSCPHAACPLGYDSSKKLIECPCHSSRFFADPASNMVGAVQHPPAQAALLRWKATALTTGGGTLLTIDLKQTLLFECEDLPAVDTAKQLTLTYATFPQLMMVGGVVCGSPQGLGNPIIVTRTDANTVIAVDSICTHLGCTVEWHQDAMDFQCPCHGSTFGPDGSVKVGPATTPLKSYAVQVNADGVVVTIP
jgi:Rieske Fe-S protein